MVLSKRKRTGEFIIWTPPGQSLSTTAGPTTAGGFVSPPKAKEARTTARVSEDTYIPHTPPTASSYSYSSKAPPTYAPPLPSEPPLKKSRKKAVPDAPQEKRGAIFKKKCPQNILERVGRVMSQRFFMIDRNRTSSELREEFSVLGSTGNVYTVVIDHRPSCNCPDASKGNHCKHILFIFLKVLQVTQASGFWYQKALLTSELEQIFAKAPLAPNAVAHPRVREAHALRTEKTPSMAPSTNTNKRKPGPDDDCPICYESMGSVSENALVFCDDCGNALHKECFQQWQRSSARDGKPLTCVWCRARWALPGGASAGSSGSGRTSEGYINLADVSGVSPVRDSSSYYHGPRKGRRYYGYQDYEE